MGTITFIDELKGGRQFFLFFHFRKRFSVSNHVFSYYFGVTLLVGPTKQFLTKMGNEIAYLMPTKYKIFAAPLQPPQGGQLPGPLRTPRSHTVLPTIQNGMTPMHKRAQRCGGGAGGL